MSGPRARTMPSTGRCNEVGYSANQEQLRPDVLRFSGIRGISWAADARVEQCMADC